MEIDIQIKDTSLLPQTCVDFVTNGGAGGIAVFIGTVRNQTKGKKVLRLDFESYQPMAISEMKKIAKRAGEKWPIQKMAIHHRVGSLAIEEIAVVIAVATPHRKAAFEAWFLFGRRNFLKMERYGWRRIHRREHYCYGVEK